MYKSINGNTKRNAIINSGIYLLKCKIKYRRGAVNEKNIGITLIIIIVIIPIIFYFVLHNFPATSLLVYIKLQSVEMYDEPEAKQMRYDRVLKN